MWDILCDEGTSTQKDNDCQSQNLLVYWMI